MTDQPTNPKKGVAIGWFVFLGCALGVIVLGLLATSILERRNQAAPARLQLMKPIDKFEANNAKWGVNFPREFNSWESTKLLNENTKYAGSNVRDYLEASPDLVVMWAGFSFGKQYNQARGHQWAIQDVTSTARVSDKTPATCWTCKSPDVPRMMEKIGIDKFYAGKFNDLKKEIVNPIGCGDCHNNETMALQVSRPALKEAYSAMGKDINKASHQELRSLVCAQCHVTYYFENKQTNKLIFPWRDGLNADDMDKYFERVGFSDFTHAISGAKMVKMRHPDFEIYSQGTHAFRGVSCADCHMPYKSEGGIKYTDHQIRSPLYNIANSCQVCHRWSEDEVRSKVYSIQDKTFEMLHNAQKTITLAHLEIGDAIRLGATDAELETSRHLVRRAQMYWDYVAANNGMGFHAPQECARVLDKALQIASDCRLDINRIRAKHGAIEAFVMPDLSTKEKAAAYVEPFIEAQKARDAAAKKVAAK